MVVRIGQDSRGQKGRTHNQQAQDVRVAGPLSVRSGAVNAIETVSQWLWEGELMQKRVIAKYAAPIIWTYWSSS